MKPVDEPTPQHKVIMITDQIKNLDLSKGKAELTKELNTLTSQIEDNLVKNKDVISQANVEIIQDHVKTMSLALERGGSLNEAVQLISQVKAKIVKRQ
jgi:hypothetical protein